MDFQKHSLLLFSLLVLLVGSAQSQIVEAETITVLPGDTFSIAITSANMPLLMTAQGSIQWDPDILAPVSTVIPEFVTEFNLPIPGPVNQLYIGMSQATFGRIGFAWDAGSNLAGEPAPVTLFKLNFIALGTLGSSTPISFVDQPTAREFSEPDPFLIAAPFPVTFTNGEVLVGGPGFPVTWLGFEAASKAGGVDLRWETASETNNEYFEVERATIGGDFEVLGKVVGAGTTSEVKSYSFFDSEVPQGKLRYRVKQVDLNGAFSYSNVVELLHDDIHLGLYPNPARNFLEVKLPVTEGTIGHLTLRDMQGRELSRYLTTGQTTERLSLKGVASGWYVLSFHTAEGLRLQTRFLKAD